MPPPCNTCCSGVHKEPGPVPAADVAVQQQWAADDDCAVARCANCRIGNVVNCQRVQCHVGRLCRNIPRCVFKYDHVDSLQKVFYRNRYDFLACYVCVIQLVPDALKSSS